MKFAIVALHETEVIKDRRGRIGSQGNPVPRGGNDAQAVSFASVASVASISALKYPNSVAS